MTKKVSVGKSPGKQGQKKTASLKLGSREYSKIKEQNRKRDRMMTLTDDTVLCDRMVQ